MKIKLVIIFIFLCSASLSQQISSKFTSEQSKMLKQAKSLQKNGLIDESTEIYYKLFNNYPFLYEALKPLKSILKQKKDWAELMNIADKYLLANKNSIQAKIHVFDIYLWSDNTKWETILYSLININMSLKFQWF